jgi:hypothetical protein
MGRSLWLLRAGGNFPARCWCCALEGKHNRLSLTRQRTLGKALNGAAFCQRRLPAGRSPARLLARCDIRRDSLDGENEDG